MSLWLCPTHGLVGPIACCDKARWAHVDNQPLAADKAPLWSYSTNELKAELERRRKQKHEDL